MECQWRCPRLSGSRLGHRQGDRRGSWRTDFLRQRCRARNLLHCRVTSYARWVVARIL